MVTVMEKLPGNERQRVLDCNHQGLNGMNGDECLEPPGNEYFVKAFGKVFQIAFAINASMSGSFAGTMNQSAQMMRGLSENTRFLNSEQRRLDAVFREGSMSMAEYRANMQRLRGEMATRPQALEDIAFASSYVQNGQFVGFRLRPGRDQQLLRQLGLNSGDVITEINGSRLNNPMQGFSMLQEVMSADQVSVRVLRSGAEIPLTFSLSSPLPR